MHRRQARTPVPAVAGGLGLAPLRAPIYWVSEHSDEYKDVHVLYGTKEPGQMLFTYQYDEWEKVNHINLLTIVEKPSKDWNGRTGLITESTLLGKNLIQNTRL